MSKNINAALVIKLGALIPLYMLTVSIGCAEEQEPAATPYRPTISNPAALSASGWLELEMGLQRIEGGADKRRDSLPVLAKLAFGENWGVLVGGELGIRRTDTGNEIMSGNGDTTLLLKYRIPTAVEGAAFGIEAGYKAATAPDSIGSGKSDYIVNGIYSAEMGAHQLDLNLNATKLGAYADGEGSIQYGWAVAVSHGLNEQWGVFGEMSGISRSATAATAQLMAGANYNWSKRVVLDVGAARGLTKESQDWTVFAGITTLLGKLW